MAVNVQSFSSITINTVTILHPSYTLSISGKVHFQITSADVSVQLELCYFEKWTLLRFKTMNASKCCYQCRQPSKLNLIKGTDVSLKIQEDENGATIKMSFS